MRDKPYSAKQNNEHKKGGKYFPALCDIIGTLIILLVIASLLPMTLLQHLGFEVYNVVSGSMEPAIPVGSMIVVRPVDWKEIQAGDVIAFQREGTVTVHRVLQNRIVEGEFVTKGDANENEDLSAVSFRALIGRVERHVPVYGSLMALLTTAIGKIYLGMLLLCGLLFCVLGSRLRALKNGGSNA